MPKLQGLTVGQCLSPTPSVLGGRVLDCLFSNTWKALRNNFPNKCKLTHYSISATWWQHIRHLKWAQKTTILSVPELTVPVMLNHIHNLLIYNVRVTERSKGLTFLYLCGYVHLSMVPWEAPRFTVPSLSSKCSRSWKETRYNIAYGLKMALSHWFAFRGHVPIQNTLPRK